MRRWVVIVSTVAISCAAQAENVQTTLDYRRSVYDQELQKIETEAGKQQEAWPVQYQRALKSMDQAFQSGGDLDSLLVIQEETARFSKSKLIPEDVVSKKLPKLAALQKATMHIPVDIEVNRSRQIIALYDKYMASLEELKKTLTKQRLLDDAVKVNGDIENIKSSSVVSAAKFVLEAAGEVAPAVVPPVAPSVAPATTASVVKAVSEPVAPTTMSEAKKQLFEEFDAAVEPLRDKYVAQLEALKATLTQQKNIPGLRAVQQELEAVNISTGTQGAGSASEGPVKPPLELKKLHSNYQNAMVLASKSVIAKYDSALQVVLRNAKQNSDLLTADATQKELTALHMGSSSANVISAPYVDTEWTIGAAGENGKFQTFSVWRNGATRGPWGAIGRWHPVGVNRIRAIRGDGSGWHEDLIFEFNCTEGTFEAHTPKDPKRVADRGRAIGRVDPAKAPKLPSDVVNAKK